MMRSNFVRQLLSVVCLEMVLMWSVFGQPSGSPGLPPRGEVDQEILARWMEGLALLPGGPSSDAPERSSEAFRSQLVLDLYASIMESFENFGGLPQRDANHNAMERNSSSNYANTNTASSLFYPDDLTNLHEMLTVLQCMIDSFKRGENRAQLNMFNNELAELESPIINLEHDSTNIIVDLFINRNIILWNL